MISVRNISKYYGEKCAVDNVSFEAKEGDIIGLLGPNGAGKTTTMRIITAYFPASSGSVLINDSDVFENSIEVRKMIGYLPEHVPLYLDMSVVEFLVFAAAAKGISPGKIDDKVSEVMEKCSITAEADTVIGTLSKGYRQRVGLAQAIINDPKILVLDEPTVGLDPNQVVEIRDLIRQIGTTSVVILSSHILEEVSKICTKVIIMKNGRVLAIDTPENLSSGLEGSDRLLIEFGSEYSKLEKILSSAEGVKSYELTSPSKEPPHICTVQMTPSPELLSSLSRKIVESGIPLYGFHRNKLTLEEIFTSIVKEEGVQK